MRRIIYSMLVITLLLVGCAVSIKVGQQPAQQDMPPGVQIIQPDESTSVPPMNPPPDQEPDAIETPSAPSADI